MIPRVHNTSLLCTLGNISSLTGIATRPDVMISYVF